MGEKIKVEVELDDDFLESVMVTCVESGYDCLGYWASEVTDVKRKADLMVTSFKVVADDGTGRRCTATINGSKVARAIEDLMASRVRLGYPLAYINQAVADRDPGAIDATAADAIVQAAMFGEVVYG